MTIMKNKLYTIGAYICLVILLATNYAAHAQIILNPATHSASGNLGQYGPVSISIPSEALTGDNIALNITLPGNLPANCTKSVTVATSSNLLFQTASDGFPFSAIPGSSHSVQNDTPLVGNDGQNFNVVFKFPPYITCNGAVGTFEVTVTTECGGQIVNWKRTVSVTARADNYWTISKEYVTGNLTCGISSWRIWLKHNNPNGAGLGTYSINGTITENPAVPIISDGLFNVNFQEPNGNYNYVYMVSLQNCANEGSTITNEADYELILGGGCTTMNGTVTATSLPMASPNAIISFSKDVVNQNNTNLSPGCQGKYAIAVCNIGNVPWTNLEITDNFNIPGITLIGTPQIPTGWIVSNNSGAYTLSNPNIVLNPGDCAQFFFDFEIDQGATVGSTISNTAYLSYQTVGVGGSTPPIGGTTNNCPGIDCPTIQTSVQNTESTATFVVEAPRPIPSILKCIVDPPNTLVPPLYSIGNTIKFKIMIGNSGAASLNDVVSDAMDISGQNLQIIPSSINYKYYADEWLSNQSYCNPNFGTPAIPPPFPVTANTTDLHNPTWTISGMPGICDYYRANFLVIEFEALILPQLHGSKTNRATIPYNSNTLSSAVNYSIDQVGVLAVHKAADVEVVDNGQPFNYIITVSNNGSVPLNNLVITDQLPDCVNLGSRISIVDVGGTAIPYTTTGSLQIAIDPATLLQPGESFTITIPVVKSGNGSCCNIMVAATANMTLSNIALSANYGSAEQPAACVTSPPKIDCCDIPDFDAAIQRIDGQYYVTINGGAIPIQSLEISVADYHVAYSEDACKPADMGIFGTLSSNTTNLSGLLLNTGDNNTNSLTWSLGAPSVLNNATAVLSILNPAVLDLECCEVSFSFCLKVSVMDANCNVCERFICFESEQGEGGDGPGEEEPCDIKIRDISNKEPFCPGTSMTLQWTGTVPSGSVNIFLYDVTNGSAYQVLAAGIPNSGTFSFTIPSDIPCDPAREWMLVIEDADRKCMARSNSFKIECCKPTACGCGRWKTSTISIAAQLIATPLPNSARYAINPISAQQVDCGRNVQLNQSTSYSFTAPDYICAPENCEVSYVWEVILPNQTSVSDNGKTFNYTFNAPGTYQVVFTPICGGERCDPCVITVSIPRGGNPTTWPPAKF